MFFVNMEYECVHIHECMLEAAIVLVEQIPSNNGALGEGPEAEMRASPARSQIRGWTDCGGSGSFTSSF